jgi:outer membrane protein assembly factor BamB
MVRLLTRFTVTASAVLAALLPTCEVCPRAAVAAEASGSAKVPSASPPREASAGKRTADWPRFLGPTADGKSPETGIVAPWPANGPRVVWHRKVGTGYGIGCVSQGKYYHFDRVSEAGADGEGQLRLLCLDAASGTEIWTYRYETSYQDQLGYDDGPRASPVIDENRVYLFGPEGTLSCVQARDAQLVWKVDTAATFGVVQNFFGVGSTPVVVDDLLLCLIGGSPAGSRGLYESGGRVEGNGTGIVAFDKLTGAVRYKITDELASYATIQTATIDGRKWAFAFARGGLVGFDPVQGKVDFQYPWRARMLESVNASTPVVVGNEVFISEAYEVGSSLLAVRPAGYDVVWCDDARRRAKSFKAHWNTPVYVDGFLYGCSGRHAQDAELRCVEWKTGRVRWSETGPRPERSSLIYADGYLIAMGEFGSLQLIRVNPDRYDPVSAVTLKGDDGEPLLQYPCWAAPILANGRMYLRGDREVVCVELIPGVK